MRHIDRHAAIAALVLLLSSCSGDSIGVDPTTTAGRLGPRIIGGPTLVPNPNPAAPLTAIASITTDVPTQVELKFFDGTNRWTELAVEEFETRHNRVPVLGMRPGRTHWIGVTVRDAHGNETTAPGVLSFTTPPLPATFPPMQVTASHPTKMEPGVTLLTIFSFRPGALLVMLDAAGEVVWYLDGSLIPATNGQVFNGKPMPNGNMMLLVQRRLMLEVDMLGNLLNGWFASRLLPPPMGTIPVDVDSFHHDILALPTSDPADFAVLSTELRVLSDYPSDEVDITQTTPTANVVGDTILEFKRDGTIVREFKLLDLIDPYRICYGTLDSFWTRHYQLSQTYDWSHANAIVIDPSDDSYILSARHQDAVVKIDRATNSLRWILGPAGRWTPPWDGLLLTPIGTGFEWFYHQHAPEIGANGGLLLFDNGNHRAIPPAPRLLYKDNYSRAVEFELDEVARTVSQRWAYGGRPNGNTQSFFNSFFVGDANRLPITGNVLVCDGGRQISNTVPRRFGRIAEVSSDPAPKTFFEVYVRDNAHTGAVGYAVYRAYHLPSVYPR